MSILSSINSGRKLAPINAGILEELGWVFHENTNIWKHDEYIDVEIYKETSFRKEVKEKRARIPGNWYAREYVYPTIIDIYSSLGDPKIKIIPLNSIGDLDLIENHRIIKKYSI